MDQHTTVGVIGWVTSWGLADYHLTAASIAATLTAIYMGVAIFYKLKNKK